MSVVRPAAVRVDDRTVGLDLHLITWYGHSVPTIAETVRTVVAEQVAADTGLTVAVVTVTVDDLLVPGVDVSGALGVRPEDG
ncbi:Asp23/Gls24 family envelope stress response protein [Micromonospora sp. WMMD1120]|uniref:Asp23/Gls24 family envelope stress response protein n=1 Tax=Micromonospora sp. WMMD1120 TaxID=3016106 RepID=UPI0024178AB3|nr:Asp23/Gls24 family envelope stress response protein [Micromonospora sp. WMMD1120]MDG4810226.1 Asp23/Gls24 family envelope stress response protein [Micromonospora sp. WMMD1120]